MALAACGLWLLLLAACGSTKHPAGGGSAPAFARTVRLEPVSGKVMVSAAGNSRQSRPVRLTAPVVVPVGTRVDTTAGSVRLTSATAPPTKLQSGEFHGGIFQVRQANSQGGLTDLVIIDNVPRREACGPPGHVTPSTRILGLLRGNAKGRFLTTGRFAAGLVRGTEWGVRDRCDGTFTVVQQGTVLVHDLRLNKNIVLHAGQTYLAKAA